MRDLNKWIIAVAVMIVFFYWGYRLLFHPGMIAWEFHQYYAAGKLPGDELYNANLQFETQKQIWEENLKSLRVFSFGPFLKPAYYRIVLVPLASLSFWKAYGVWAAVQAVAFVIAIVILAKRYGMNPAFYIVIPLCPFLMTPVIWGQDPPLVFMLVVVAFELLLRKWEFAAGAVLALSLVKWNILLLFPLLFLVRRQWRALAGFAAVASAELAISLWITGISGIVENISILHLPSHLWDKMAALRGILLALKVPDFINIPLMLGSAAWVLWSLRRLDVERAFALCLPASIFLAYHTMGYDVLFLFLPIFVFQHRLQSGWTAGLTVFMMSPIGEYAGMFFVAVLFLVFLIVIFREAFQSAKLARVPSACQASELSGW